MKDSNDRYVSTSEACKFLGRSRSWLEAKRNPNAQGFDETFPRPFKISRQANAYHLGELIDWIESRRVDVRGAA